MTIALQNNLKKLMIKHSNMSVSDLAKATLLPQPTLYQLYTGVTENPRKKTLRALATYFSITVNQLIGEDTLPSHLPEKIKKQLELKTAPLLSWDDLPHWPDHINFDNKKEIFLDEKSNQTTFALTMPDNSMEPIFPKHSLLIFDVKKATEDNDCAIIFLKKSQQFSFKKIRIREKIQYAQSINPASEHAKPTALTKQDKIFATLREARLSF